MHLGRNSGTIFLNCLKMNQDKIAHKIRNVRENPFRLTLNSVWSKTNIIKGTVGGAGQPRD